MLKAMARVAAKGFWAGEEGDKVATDVNGGVGSNEKVVLSMLIYQRYIRAPRGINVNLQRVSRRD